MTDIGNDLSGYVSLDEIGRGAPYILQAGQGEHRPVRGSFRSLLARAEDTDGHIGVALLGGNTAAPTAPHYHRKTVEAVYVLGGMVRVWQDDQKGTRIVRDLHPGDFGLLPPGWTHAWAFGAQDTRFLSWCAPGGFEGIFHHLDPETLTTAEGLHKTEELFDVVWLPEFKIAQESEIPSHNVH
ncbi:quercetin 2,3-dioxygenase [Nocardia vinacea]|uniref:quercetin 2,3-dioxygenase n=1 Tax=Nocardia vinacea TaxID=96468 RepID=UPI00342FB3FE